MAARRLIIIMLLLLGISTGIAIVAPSPKDDSTPEETAPPTGSTGTTNPTPSEGPGTGSSDLVKATISPDDKPKTIKAKPGERLVLKVNPGRASDLEIPELGLTGTTTPYAPVTFDMRLPDDPGRFEVIELTGKKLAVIVTSD